MIERPISERLSRSTGIVHIDTVPDRTPQGRRSDFLATFIDHHNVIEDCKGDNVKMKEVLIWVVTIVMVQFRDLIRNSPKLVRRIRTKFANEANPTGVFDPNKLKLKIIDYRFIPISTRETQAKFWFQILPL